MPCTSVQMVRKVRNFWAAADVGKVLFFVKAFFFEIARDFTYVTVTYYRPKASRCGPDTVCVMRSAKTRTSRRFRYPPYPPLPWKWWAAKVPRRAVFCAPHHRHSAWTTTRRSRAIVRDRYLCKISKNLPKKPRGAGGTGDDYESAPRSTPPLQPGPA